MKARYITAAVAIPIFSIVIIFGHHWLYAGFILAVGLLAALEAVRILGQADLAADQVPVLAGTLVVLAGAGWRAEPGLAAGLLAAIVLVAGAAIVSRRPVRVSLARMAAGLSVPLLLGMGLGHLILLRDLDLSGLDGRPVVLGKALVFYLFAVVWLGDTAAMHVGKRWGRHKLAPVLSPKKTVEGFAAALGGGLVVSFLFDLVVPQIALAPLHLAVLGLALPALGHAGDLTESLFKRAGNTKDSGTLVPGHGGFFDRVDSTLLTAPALYFYVRLVLA